MLDIDSEIIQAYQGDKLSEMQVAEKLQILPKIVRRVLNKNKIVRRSRSEAGFLNYATRHGQKEFILKENLNEEERLLKMSGIMLYWGEGTKKGVGVAFSNSDPEMIKVFMRFLREICGVDSERIHATIHYYEDHTIAELVQFWSEVASIPVTQFYKSYLHQKHGGTYRDPSRYGTISIQYSDKRLLAVLKSWIEESKTLFIQSATFS
jgi:hypothetical protein